MQGDNSTKESERGLVNRKVKYPGLWVKKSFQEGKSNLMINAHERLFLGPLECFISLLIFVLLTWWTPVPRVSGSLTRFLLLLFHTVVLSQLTVIWKEQREGRKNDYIEFTPQILFLSSLGLSTRSERSHSRAGIATLRNGRIILSRTSERTGGQFQRTSWRLEVRHLWKMLCNDSLKSTRAFC